MIQLTAVMFAPALNPDDVGKFKIKRGGITIELQLWVFKIFNHPNIIYYALERP